MSVRGFGFIKRSFANLLVFLAFRLLARPEVGVQGLLHQRPVLLRVGIDESDPPIAELVVLGRGLPIFTRLNLAAWQYFEPTQRCTVM